MKYIQYIIKHVVYMSIFDIIYSKLNKSFKRVTGNNENN